MGKVVTIHQPNYLPWIGFFSKIKKSDCLILGDTYVLGGQSVFNRNKIRTHQGWCYLTIPLGRKTEGCRICDILLPSDKSWQKAHWKMIHDNYAKSKYFDLYKEDLQGIYQNSYESICQLNEKIIYFLIKYLNIEVEIIRASELKIDPDLRKSDLMVALLEEAGAETYISGPSGRKYLEFEKFRNKKIEVKFIEFVHPEYQQRFPGFEPNLSAIDILFNMGPQASEIIDTAAQIVD